MFNLREGIGLGIESDHVTSTEIHFSEQAVDEQIESSMDVISTIEKNNDEITESANELVTIHETLSESMEHGGLGVESSIILNKWLGTIASRHELPVSAVTVSTEDFRYNSKESTVVSMEKVKEFFQGVKKGAIDLLYKIVHEVKALFMKLVGLFAPKLSRRIARLRKDADRAANNKPGEKIKLYYARELQEDGKLGVSSHMVDKLNFVQDSIADYFKATNTYQHKVIEAVSKMLESNSGKYEEYNVNYARTQLKEAANNLLGEGIFGKGKVVKKDNGETEYISELLFGGAHLSVTVAGDDSFNAAKLNSKPSLLHISRTISRFKFEVENKLSNEDKMAAYEIEKLNKDQIISVANDCFKILKIAEEAKNNMAKSRIHFFIDYVRKGMNIGDDQAERFKSLAEQQNIDTTHGDKLANQLKLLVKVITANTVTHFTSLYTASSKIVKWCFSLIRAFVSYAEQSMGVKPEVKASGNVYDGDATVKA